MLRIGIGLFFALCAMFLHSLTEWVFRQSPIYYVGHILLGAMAALYYIRRRKAAATSRDRQAEPEAWEAVPAGALPAWEPGVVNR
jgi:hypothetical protein